MEWFIPVNARDVSVTFVHGGGGQGSEFLRTPDGRPGWAHAFLQAGFPVYVLDRPGHGRSHWNEATLGASLPQPSYETLYPRFVEPARHALWPESQAHTQWPSDAPQAGDRFMASQGVMANSLVSAQRHSEAISAELFALTSDTVLISHSAGGPCGWAMASIGGPKVKAIIAIEPQGEPGLTHPQGTFSNGLCAAEFQGTHDPYDRPITFVTGEATWMRGMNARASEYLRQQGYDITHLWLEQHGIHGNGHMLMSEKNSDDIAALLIKHLSGQLQKHR
ncbi:alpha/beta fold hydrolase [Comamonas humi]